MGRERERERERERGRGVVPGVEVELGPDHNFLDTAVVETDLDHRAEVVGTLGEETEAIAGTAGAAAVDNKESDSLIIFDTSPWSEVRTKDHLDPEDPWKMTVKDYAWQDFGEGICQVLLGVNREDIDGSIGYFISDKVMFGINVFGPLMIAGIRGQISSTLVVNKERNGCHR